MPSSRPRVWLITGTQRPAITDAFCVETNYRRLTNLVLYTKGASSPLGYPLCLAALSRGDLVIASASTQKDVDRLSSVGAHGIKMECEMSFTQVKDKIREAVSYYGRVDFLINNPDAPRRRDSSAHESLSDYDANTFSYAAIQVTKAVSQVSEIRQIAVIVPDGSLGHSEHGFINSIAMTNNVEAIARLLASEYRPKKVRVLLINPASAVSLVGGSASRYSVGDPRIAVERIITQMTEGGTSESGIRVL